MMATSLFQYTYRIGARRLVFHDRAPSTAKRVRNSLYETIRENAPFEEKAREALELGVKYLNVDNGHLTRIDQETGHWKAAVSTDPPDGQFPPGLSLPLGGRSYLPDYWR